MFLLVMTEGSRLTIHPGWQCRPWRLCGHSSIKYVHLLTWDEGIKQVLFAVNSIDNLWSANSRAVREIELKPAYEWDEGAVPEILAPCLLEKSEPYSPKCQSCGPS